MQQLDAAAVQDYFRNLFSWKERRSGGMIQPDERLPWGETIALGIQHVLAMFGATVLAPILMGFDPNTAIFFSGIGTIIFFIITGGKIPSYLGSSFAFISPVAVITGATIGAFDPDNIPYALGGIIICGLIYTVIGVIVAYYGSDWIDELMPPIVTGAVVAIIGLNLAHSGAKGLAESNMPLAIITMLAIVLVAILGKGLVGRLSILIGTTIGYLFALILGGTTTAGRDILGIRFQGVNLDAVKDASIIGLPNFTAPKFDGSAIGLLVPVAIILVAENTGHIKAISEMTGRNMMPYLGRGFIGDGVATMVSGAGGGTGVTTYAENIGVMSLTKVFSTAMFVVAAAVAIILGFSPVFGALVLSIPAGVLGGVSVVLFGLIAAAGIRIWIDNRVDFSRPENLFLAAIVLIVGTADLTWIIGDFHMNGIVLGTFGAILLNQLFVRLQGPDDEEDYPVSPASAGDPGPDAGGFAGELRGRMRDHGEERPRRRRTGQPQERRPIRHEQPVMPPLDDFDDFEPYPEEQPAPPRHRGTGQPQERRPIRKDQPPAQGGPPRRRPRPQPPRQDQGFVEDDGMPPPPQMPQPPVRRRNLAPEIEPDGEEWDDDLGFIPEDPRNPGNR